MPAYVSLVFTSDFMAAYSDRRLTTADRAAILRALERLDQDESHPSLRVHPLRGRWQGLLAASASDSLRLRFRRLPGGRKELLDCSKHYDD